MLLQPNGLFSENQLFFVDHVHGVIRSRENERLCLEVQGNNRRLGTLNRLPFNSINSMPSDSNLVLNSCQSNHPGQHLEFRDGKVFLRREESLVLTLGIASEPCDPASMQCYLAEDIDSHHQKWILKYAWEGISNLHAFAMLMPSPKRLSVYSKICWMPLQCRIACYLVVHFLRSAKPFFIESKVNGKVLEVRREAGQGSCNVIFGDRKPNTRNACQLWYEDELGILRSKLNGSVLDFSYGIVCWDIACRPNPTGHSQISIVHAGKLHTDRYNSINPHQSWVISKEYIKNRNNGLVLDIHAQKKWIGSSIGLSESKSTDSQKWRFLYAWSIWSNQAQLLNLIPSY